MDHSKLQQPKNSDRFMVTFLIFCIFAQKKSSNMMGVMALTPQKSKLEPSPLLGHRHRRFTMQQEWLLELENPQQQKIVTVPCPPFCFFVFLRKKVIKHDGYDGSNSLKKQVRAIPIAGTSSPSIALATGEVAGA